MAHIVVIGAGQAGASLTAKLRNLGHDGPITLIGEEPVPPYQRPPLSKGYMSGKVAFEQVLLRPEDWYEPNRIELLRDARAEAVDRGDRIVTLTDGRRIGYDRLVFATGARPRRLPAEIGGHLPNV